MRIRVYALSLGLALSTWAAIAAPRAMAAPYAGTGLEWKAPASGYSDAWCLRSGATASSADRGMWIRTKGSYPLTCADFGFALYAASDKPTLDTYFNRTPLYPSFCWDEGGESGYSSALTWPEYGCKSGYSVLTLSQWQARIDAQAAPPSGGGGGGLPTPTVGDCPDVPPAYTGSDDAAAQTNALRTNVHEQCVVVKQLLSALHDDLAQVHTDVAELPGARAVAHADAVAILDKVTAVGAQAHDDNVADRGHFDAIEDLLGPLGAPIDVQPADGAVFPVDDVYGPTGPTGPQTVELGELSSAAMHSDALRVGGAIWFLCGLAAALFVVRFVLPKVLP